MYLLRSTIRHSVVAGGRILDQFLYIQARIEDWRGILMRTQSGIYCLKPTCSGLNMNIGFHHTEMLAY